MKFKTTAKEVKNGYYRIISIGYCGLQTLLSYESPCAYSRGVYGWNFDLYDFNGVAICTGYRMMPSKNTIKNNYELVREYEKKAEGRTAEQKKELISEFIAKCLNGVK